MPAVAGPDSDFNKLAFIEFFLKPNFCTNNGTVLTKYENSLEET